MVITITIIPLLPNFFYCVESYDSHITYPSSDDVKSPLVAKVYFECISFLSDLDNLQLASSRNVKEVLYHSQLECRSIRDLCSTYSHTIGIGEISTDPDF